MSYKQCVLGQRYPNYLQNEVALVACELINPYFQNKYLKSHHEFYENLEKIPAETEVLLNKLLRLISLPADECLLMAGTVAINEVKTYVEEQNNRNDFITPINFPDSPEFDFAVIRSASGELYDVDLKFVEELEAADAEYTDNILANTCGITVVEG